MEAVIDVINAVDSFVWGIPMLVLLLGSHIFMTFRTGFIQRKLPTAIKLSITKDPDAPGDISQFGALCTALSATIGTGNIVGVGTAIIAGGPGAVLWMWLTGVFGIATKYSETYAAVKYRVKDHNGNMLGGAMYAWKRAFKKGDGTTPWWAMLGAGAFAVFAAVASFGIGSAVQSSAMTEVITTNLPGIPTWGIGLAIVIMVSAVIFGGVKVISRVCEKLVPFMALAYAWGCIMILGMNWEYVWPALCLIVECAFTPKAAFGGALGSGLMLALQFGCARGLFSNESGLGSAPIVASAASTRNPARQALVSMTGTFWDTVVICLLTGLVLVSTMLGNADLQAQIMAGSITAGAQLTSAAFAEIPYIGTPILVFGMILFAYSTILGWSYYGNRCVTYLFGKRAIRPYQVLYVIVAFLGAIGIGDVVWTISDITNALMAVPNIIMVLLLSGLIARETRHYVYEGNLGELDETPIPQLESK
ncbi:MULTISPECIES: sodium:alanine symporter family protein [unclassified Adlercreutzia]|uniref:alanine/glycine:cation symporter family protein n=1 Tax=unclassified Adlercreutzia TaxID=2636013 RepID=UPI0013ED5AEE|nr:MULTISPECIES: sodium:alanine symporter family protein [unclassified Adlercreutzia]